jgi:rare lipoprotein A
MNMKIFGLVLIFLLTGLDGCSNQIVLRPDKVKRSPWAKTKRKPATQRPYVIGHRTYYPIPSAKGYSERGIASWYGKPFHGRTTSNGETYNMYGHTAAHKTLPMNTMLLVKNVENGKTAVVRINDRGPFARKRIIDLSYTTAKELGILKNGTAMVKIVALGEEKKRTAVKPVAQKTNAPPVERQLIHQDFDKGNFYIQVGAFEHKKQAKKLARTFANLGRDVIIEQFPAAGISLYRVMVFSSTSLKEARKMEAYLEKHGYPNALVIAWDDKRKKRNRK